MRVLADLRVRTIGGARHQRNVEAARIRAAVRCLHCQRMKLKSGCCSDTMET